MSKNQPQIPIEGDMIFEKVIDFQLMLAFFITRSLRAINLNTVTKHNIK